MSYNLWGRPVVRRRSTKRRSTAGVKILKKKVQGRNVRVGPNNGRYIMKNGRKVYLPNATRRTW